MQYCSCDVCGKPITDEKIPVQTPQGELFVCQDCEAFEDDLRGGFGGR